MYFVFRNIEAMATLRNKTYRIRMLKYSLTRLSPEGLSQAIYSRYPIRQSQTIEISEYQQRSHLGRPGCKRYDDTHHQRAHADYQL